MTPEQAQQIASGIVIRVTNRMASGYYKEAGVDPKDQLREHITAALLATNPPKGHITLPDGRWVKVSGTLPMTADGCVVGANVTIWHPEHGASDCRYLVDGGTWATPSDPAHPQSGSLYEVAECFSTRQAAEAAAKEQR